MYGPRQGVYTFHQFPLRPHSQQLWQWSQVHHSVKWRQSQLKNPDESYKYRCRTEPQNAAQPVSQPTSVSRPSSACHVRPTLKRGPQRSASTVCLSSSRSNSRLPTRHGGREQQNRSSNRNTARRNTKQTGTPALPLSVSTPQFSLTAQAVNIQPRPFQKSSSPTHDEDSISLTPPFPYPDPLTVSGDPSFEDRLAELAKLECETIRHEEAIRRYSTPLLSRPSSAKNIRQTASKTKVQSVQRVSRNVSSKELRAQSSVLRGYRVSLPATARSVSKPSTHTTRPNPNASSIGRTEKSRAVSQAKSTVVDKVKDTAVTAPEVVHEQHSKSEVPGCSDTIQNETQPITSSDEIDTVSELSCSPPIVYVTSLPSYSPITNTTVKDGAVKDLPSPEEHHPPSPVMNAWSDDNTVTASHGQALEDDLQATSDLGLSIDSLHLIDDENMSKEVIESQADKDLANENSSYSVHAISSVGITSTPPVYELQTTETLHVPRKGSAGRRNSSTSSGSSSNRSQKRHIKTGLKHKSSHKK